MLKVDISHIDTCLGCYLNDHHNRKGECLVGVYVDGNTTYAALREGLESELHSYGTDDQSRITDAMLSVAIEDCFKDTDSSEVFDDSLEVPAEDEEFDADSCQAWFLVTWYDDAEESCD